MNNVAHSSSFPVHVQHSLEELRAAPHSAATIAALLAVCDHPEASRVAFIVRVGEGEGDATEVQTCGLCGAVQIEGCWIRPGLARLVKREQLTDVEQIGFGLHEIVRALRAIEARFALGVPCDQAEIALLVACVDEIANLASAQADKLGPAFARLAAGDGEDHLGWGG